MFQVVRVIVPLVLNHRGQRLDQEAQHHHDGGKSRQGLNQGKHLSDLPAAPAVRRALAPAVEARHPFAGSKKQRKT